MDKKNLVRKDADKSAENASKAVVKENNKNDLGGKIVSEGKTGKSPETKKEPAAAPVDKTEVEQALKNLEQAKAAYEKAKEEYKKLTGKSKKSSEPKGPGVISTIQELLTGSGKKGITKNEILDELVKRFPDREKDAMEKTINVQLPGRMSKEKGLNIKKSEEGRFFIAA